MKSSFREIIAFLMQILNFWIRASVGVFKKYAISVIQRYYTISIFIREGLVHFSARNYERKMQIQKKAIWYNKIRLPWLRDLCSF